MATCECLAGCPFFNDKMPMEGGLATIYKTRYCQGAFDQCARYKVFKAKGKGSLPISLYPNMLKKANEIIRTGSVN